MMSLPKVKTLRGLLSVVQALERTSRQVGYEAKLLAAVEAVNAAQKHRLFQHINRHYQGQLSGKTFAMWGLAFKPNTDDMREAPSRHLLADLWSAGAKVRAYDPEAMDEARRIHGERPDLIFCASDEEAVKGADALLLVTEWKQFRSPNFTWLAAQLRDGVIFDGRNMFEPDMVERAGLAYYGIGRGRSLRRSGQG